MLLHKRLRLARLWWNTIESKEKQQLLQMHFVKFQSVTAEVSIYEIYYLFGIEFRSVIPSQALISKWNNMSLALKWWNGLVGETVELKEFKSVSKQHYLALLNFETYPANLTNTQILTLYLNESSKSN